MSVVVCLHLWMLGKRKNAVCVGVCRVGVACQSWFAGARCCLCSGRDAACAHLAVHVRARDSPLPVPRCV